MSYALNPLHRHSTAAAVSDSSTTTSKRKLDDRYAVSDDSNSFSSYDSYSVTRMRKDQFPSSSSSSARHHHPTHTTQSANDSNDSPSRIQLFIHMLSGSNTIVVHADPSDSIAAVHEKIISLTRVPIVDQRLIYGGRNLNYEHSLRECRVENDASLQLVGRLRSTKYPQTCKVVDDIISQIFDLCRGGLPKSKLKSIKSRLTEFITLTPYQQDPEQFAGHLQIFLSARVPDALVMLYMSPIQSNSICAEDSIKLFIHLCRYTLHKSVHKHYAVIMFEFCKLLRSSVGSENVLYFLCRGSLGLLAESAEIGTECSVYVGSLPFDEVIPFLGELANGLSQALVSITGFSTLPGRISSDVDDFVAFSSVIREAISLQLDDRCLATFTLCEEDNRSISGGPLYDAFCYKDQIKSLHCIFVDLLEKMDVCLNKMEDHLNGGGHLHLGWWHYLTILKELNNISKLYTGAEETFRSRMKQRKTAICYLIVHCAKRTDDHSWIFEHKEVTNFEARKHLALMLLPEVKEDYEELHEMLIDRSHLLVESFQYIAHSESSSLLGGLFMEFKNEEATGPGVLREWFSLVFQAIFNPQNALFVTCPKDLRRFLPNPSSKVDPLHLEYFKFTGRMTALALMHKVQVGIMLDRTLFLQLAGKNVLLEDIRDADPFLYRSCKQILEMDAKIVDQDIFSLTFVLEVEELGSLKAVEICPNGQNIVVSSTNRKQYVDLLVQQRFVTSVADQVNCFAKGFGDIIGSLDMQRSFFRSLDLEDLDWLLYGSGNAISDEDWKAHTDYKGYKETDPQISWFWKIVKHMSAERKNVLLVFWTSIKHLPVDGFVGLASRLYIYNAGEACDRLPTSHTCFYRLCLPPYASISEMEDRLNIITQEHVGCSFGTW